MMCQICKNNTMVDGCLNCTQENLKWRKPKIIYSQKEQGSRIKHTVNIDFMVFESYSKPAWFHPKLLPVLSHKALGFITT